MRLLATDVAPFDTALAVQHSTCVLRCGRRVAAVAAVLTLCVGNLAVCAGWQATAEARMACGMHGTSCPMHRSESHGSGSAHTLSQAQADACCAAASNRTESAVASTTFALSNSAALPAVIPDVAPVVVPALQAWRAFVPLRVSPVPKHLVLSVLLV